MATQTPPRTAFQKWQEGIDKAENDPKWDAWDCEIQLAVNEYNRHLVGTAEYIPLDWLFIKAILWVESGPHQSQWNIKPMQIGVIGDPGLGAFLFGNEGGDLILPLALKGRLTLSSARTIPTHNIRAGIGYLLMRTAYYEHRSVLDTDNKTYETTVKPGDSFDKIAKTQGSTIDVLQKLNPTVDVRRLRPGQVLKYQKASVQRVIKGWRRMSVSLIADRYNGGDFSDYTKKLEYVLPRVRQRKEISCKP